MTAFNNHFRPNRLEQMLSLNASSQVQTYQKYAVSLPRLWKVRITYIISPPLLPSGSISCSVSNQTNEVYVTEVELSHSSQYLGSFKSSHIQHEAFAYQLLISLNQHTVLEDLNTNLILNPINSLCHFTYCVCPKAFGTYYHRIVTSICQPCYQNHISRIAGKTKVIKTPSL